MTPTALMPVDPTVSPQQAARVLTIRADLLPPEIRDGRRARRTRSLVIVLVLVTLAGLGTWYWQAGLAKQAADDEYNETFQSLTDARSDQKTKKLEALVEYQEGGEALDTELKAVLANDLSWTNMMNLLRNKAQKGVTIDEITGGLVEEESAEASDGVVGTLTVTGAAEDKRLVADYVNRLGALKHVANPFVTSVAKETDGEFTFSVSVSITDKALCGRFTSDCPSGGK
ncbi:PilN domain-containing protein [Actinoplanes hulinensis]|uniref:PilN domain-containing protein n=1 Tax=Actinoplanes hulinensis TaxID=1144547 RepID=A0ABS7AUB4_9ACTN|nr:PilN domain-containing protein [Actinoplanes hulinensis]MBW6432377.1 PilN domain-containing protein [Actinoplanes hulinensis]